MTLASVFSLVGQSEARCESHLGSCRNGTSFSNSLSHSSCILLELGHLNGPERLSRFRQLAQLESFDCLYDLGLVCYFQVIVER